MKPIIRLLPILAMSLCLFACAKKERPVTPSDGTSVVTIASPEVVIEDDCIQVFYLRNGEPVQATFQDDGLLSDPVCLDEKKWLSFGECEQTVLWDIHEDTKDVIDQMLWPSDLAFTPDGERIFFTAYNQETGKRELYWIRNGGILPVKMSQDDWWADFSVPFGFVEMADQSFSDGSKAYVVLLLVNDHWNAGEIACVYMDGRNYYTILSHENTLLRDSLSHSVMVGKNEMTTSEGTVVHYVDYTNLSQNAAGQPAERPVHIMYADVQNSSCVAWNETAIKNSLAGEKVYIVSENDFRSQQDKEEFEYFINETFK